MHGTMSSETGLRSDAQTTKILSTEDLKTSWQDYSIESLYNPMGKRYEDAYGHIPEQAQSLNWLVSQLPLGSKILDIGSGTGKPTADALVSAGHNVHGIDISESMIVVARRQVPPCHVSEDRFPRLRRRARHVRRHYLVLCLPPGHAASPDPRNDSEDLRVA